MKKYFLLTLLLISISQFSNAQITGSEELARQELAKRGLEEDEVLRKLEARGIDINNLDPSELPRLEKELEEIAKEIEEEKAEELSDQAEQALDEESKDLAKESADEIQKAVEDGASVEEAIATEVIEQQNEDLPQAQVYGHHIYRNNTVQLISESYDIKPTLDYVLGVGDVISIDIWGISEESGTYEISKEGYIKPSRMPRINLKGVTYGKAKELVRRRFAQYYNFRPEEFELSVSYSRTIKVNIVGEVLNSGAYTISAVNTGVNALAAAGGPSNIGTVRNIQIIGSAGVRKTIDLYEYLLDPSVARDYYLNENDYIFVGVADKVVRISGSVNRPFKYELKANENLNTLIDYAGGLTTRAYKGNIQITRFENDEQRILDVDFNDLQRRNVDFNLMPGDEVLINEIPAPFQNFAEVTGAVELPSKYEINAGTTVADLATKALLKEEARTDIAFLLRTNPDKTIRTIRLDLAEALSNRSSASNLAIQPKDKIIVLSSSSFQDDLPINITGAVRNPMEHPFDSERQLRVSDAVTLANGLSRDAAEFAYIFRPSPNNSQQKEYIRVDLSAVVAGPGGSSDVILSPGDELRIPSTLSFTDETFVRVAGEVRAPGEYAWDKSFTLRDALSLAGGLKIQASRSRVDISRLVIGDDQATQTEVLKVEVDENFSPVDGTISLQPFDQIYVRTAPEFEFQKNVVVQGEFTYPGTHPLIGDNDRLLDFVNRIG
ncbi:MAG: hypothetical protein HKN16_00430, partial [Saprospiraceae bacterium]|nr:hypothetical protein [Saprospiraceae bacterium]